MAIKAGKNATKARAAVESRAYRLDEAVPLLQKVKYAKFDETVDLTMRLGVDPKHADQMVRGQARPFGLRQRGRQGPPALCIAGYNSRRRVRGLKFHFSRHPRF